MAYGFTTSSDFGSRTVMFDKFASVASTPKILRADFGDGYSQRLPNGINNLAEQWDVSFVNRTSEEADDIYQYFESLGGATSFNLTYWDTNVSPQEKVIKVIATSWSRTYNQVVSNTLGYYSVTATLERVYE